MNSITVVTNYKSYHKGSLSAFFSVTLPSGLIIHECKLFEKEGRRWIGLPSRAFTGKDGGTAYAPILEFAQREAADKFRDAVLLAIDGMTGEQKRTAQSAPASGGRPANSGVPRAQIPADDSDIPF